ncbi:hypothetical protein D3C86_1833630 [compost metagenome]
MGYHNGCGVVLFCQFFDELINHDRGFRIQSGVGLIHKKILGVHGNCAGNSHALFHPSGKFSWEKFIFSTQVYPLQAEIYTIQFFFTFLIGKHI